MQVGAGLRVDSYRSGAGSNVFLDIAFGFFDHQVDVQWQRRRAVCCADDGRTDRQVGHEVPIHDIDMNPVCTRGFDGLDFLAQSGEVAGKNRRSDTDRFV